MPDIVKGNINIYKRNYDTKNSIFASIVLGRETKREFCIVCGNEMTIFDGKDPDEVRFNIPDEPIMVITHEELMDFIQSKCKEKLGCNESMSEKYVLFPIE